MFVSEKDLLLSTCSRLLPTSFLVNFWYFQSLTHYVNLKLEQLSNKQVLKIALLCSSFPVRSKFGIKRLLKFNLGPILER